MSDNLNELNEKTVEYVTNPLTNRKIKVGSDLYKKLVKAKVLGIHPDEIGRVLYNATSLEDAKQAIPKLPIVSDDLKPIIYKKNNKVVTKARKLKQTELNKQIQEVTLAVYEANMDKFNDKMTHEEIQTLIKKLVNEKLISDKNEDIPIRRRIEYLVEKEEEEEKDEIDDDDIDDDDDDDDTIYEEDE